MAYAATLGALTGELIEVATGLPSKVGRRGTHGYDLYGF
jgi:hypothetical protein